MYPQLEETLQIQKTKYLTWIIKEQIFKYK